jgi:hypothetical protein
MASGALAGREIRPVTELFAHFAVNMSFDYGLFANSRIAFNAAHADRSRMLAKRAEQIESQRIGPTPNLSRG